MEGLDNIISHQREFTLLCVGRKTLVHHSLKKYILFGFGRIESCCCASLSPVVVHELLIAQALVVASRVRIYTQSVVQA